MTRIPPGQYTNQKKQNLENFKTNKNKLKKKNYFQKKNRNRTNKRQKEASRDIRAFYRRVYHELATKIENLKKMNYKELVRFIKGKQSN